MSSRDTDNQVRPKWLRVVVTAVVYVVVARVSLLLAFEGGVASPVWPPSGIAFAALLIWGRNVWPGILIGACAANFWGLYDASAPFHTPALLSGMIAAGNTLEALTGAYLFRRLIGRLATMYRARDAFAFALIAALMCLVAGTIGPIGACLVGVTPWDKFVTTSFTWWLGDVGGVLTVTPLFLRWRVPPGTTRRGHKFWLESGTVVALLAAACFLLFSGMFKTAPVGVVGYTIIPILLWIVFRSGQRYGAIAVLGVACVATVGTSRGHGPFVAQSLNTSLLLVQVFVCTLSITLIVVATTITGRRLADAELLRIQRRQDVVLSSVPIALYTANPDKYGTTWISAHVESICGYTPEEYTSDAMFWSSRIHPDDRERTIAAYEGVLAGDSRQMEYRWRCVNGEYKWFLDHPQLIPGSDGKPGEVVGTWLDITDKKKTDIALRASESRIAAILDHSPAIISLKGADGRYLLANKKLGDVTGVPHHEILGMCDADLFPKQYADAFDDTDREVRQNGRVVEVEQMLPNGAELRTYLTLKFPIHEQSGQPPVVCAIATDITDRSRTEESLAKKSAELSRLAAELSTILKHARDFVYRHNADGIFEYASPSVEQITGFSPEYWSTHYTDSLTDNPANQVVIGNTERAIRTGVDPPAYLVEMYHKDGHPITLEVHERCYFENGKVGGIIGVARDVTERIRAEKELQRARDAADAAGRAKDVFLANLSHELRTPIMAIMGAVELAAANSTKTMSIDECRDIAVRNGQHLLALINDLLDIARMEAGGIEIVPRRCSLTEIINNVHAATASLPDASNVELRFRYETDIPDMIETDPTRLTQAVINLVGNALKFTHRGHVQVSIAVHRDQPDPRLSISVEDTGRGIPADAHDRIFENFTQVGQRRESVVSGVGLGLPLAKAISEHLGGNLSVDSEVGKGSVFTLTVATGDLTTADWRRPDEIAASKRFVDTPRQVPTIRLRARILLAEDFRDTRDLLQLALESAGATLVAVANGQEAVEAAQAQHFDLILLDIRMPVMDGREAVRRLRADGCLTPTIALTASTSPGEYDSLMADGFDDVWPKPMTISDLLARVTNYAESVPGDACPAADPAAALRDELARVRTEFIHGLPHQVGAARLAAEEHDCAALYECLHKLAGSAGIHDLPEISAESARLLKLMSNEQVDWSALSVARLCELSESVCRKH